MAYIPVGPNNFTLIDEEDRSLIKSFKLKLSSHSKKDKKYAEAYWYEDGRMVGKKLHRIIMNVNDSDVFVDHINGDGLDNRKMNLRLCSNVENLRAQRKKVTSRCKWKGLTIRNRNGRVYFEVKIKGKYIGSSECQDTAAMIYNMAAIKEYGEFANLNSACQMRG